MYVCMYIYINIYIYIYIHIYIYIYIYKWYVNKCNDAVGMLNRSVAITTMILVAILIL